MKLLTFFFCFFFIGLSSFPWFYYIIWCTICQGLFEDLPIFYFQYYSKLNKPLLPVKISIHCSLVLSLTKYFSKSFFNKKAPIRAPFSDSMCQEVCLLLFPDDTIITQILVLCVWYFYFFIFDSIQKNFFRLS